MRRVVYPGTFDPITNGHLDVLRHAAILFDEVVVAVLHNPQKRPLFDIAQRMRLAGDAIRKYTNVSVDSFEGLLVDYYRKGSFVGVVRGIRNVQDLQVEMQMAHMNESIHPNIHTIFLPTAPVFSFVSSSLVKDVAMHGGDVSPYVPVVVAEALSTQFHKSED